MHNAAKLRVAKNCCIVAYHLQNGSALVAPLATGTRFLASLTSTISIPRALRVLECVVVSEVDERTFGGGTNLRATMISPR